MLPSLPALKLPFPAAIREVVLDGRKSPSERYFRQRAVSYLRRQLGCRRIRMSPHVPAPEVAISLTDWQNRFADARSFDRLLNSVSKEGRYRLVIWTRDWLDGAYAALEVLNRYQRFLPVDREQCLPELWEASDDALDVWRWVLRLRPSAAELFALNVRLELNVSVPRELTPGDSVPWTVVAPPTVPVPPRVAPLTTVTAPPALAWLPLT